MDIDPEFSKKEAGPAAAPPVNLAGKPHLKLVLCVIAESESSVIELDWLRAMDRECDDFELHLNLKNVRDKAALADLPRVYTGRLSASRLESLLPPTDLLTVSVCGTPNFQRETAELYHSMGLPRSLLTIVS